MSISPSTCEKRPRDIVASPIDCISGPLNKRIRIASSVNILTDSNISSSVDCHDIESNTSVYDTSQETNNQTLNSSNNLSSDEIEFKAFDMSSYDTYQETISLSKNSSNLSSNKHRRVRFVSGTKVLDGPSPLFASWDRFVWDICSGLFGNPITFPIEKSNTETGGIRDDLTMEAVGGVELVLAAIHARDSVILSSENTNHKEENGGNSPISISSKIFSSPSSPRAGSHSPTEIELPQDEKLQRAVELGRRLGYEALGAIKATVQSPIHLAPSLVDFCKVIYEVYAKNDRLMLRGLHCLALELLHRLENLISSTDAKNDSQSLRCSRSIGLVLRSSSTTSTATSSMVETLHVSSSTNLSESAQVYEGDENDKESELINDDHSTTTRKKEEKEEEEEKEEDNKHLTIRITEQEVNETDIDTDINTHAPLTTIPTSLLSTFDKFLDELSASPVAELAAANFRERKNIVSIPILQFGGGSCAKIGKQHIGVLQMLISLTRMASLAYPV
jgi:hypothetical protein